MSFFECEERWDSGLNDFGWKDFRGCCIGVFSIFVWLVEVVRGSVNFGYGVINSGFFG